MITQELLEEVRERYGDSIAFIMLSSAGEEETVMDCIRRGADSYLFKPVHMPTNEDLTPTRRCTCPATSALQ